MMMAKWTTTSMALLWIMCVCSLLFGFCWGIDELVNDWIVMVEFVLRMIFVTLGMQTVLTNMSIASSQSWTRSSGKCKDKPRCRPEHCWGWRKQAVCLATLPVKKKEKWKWDGTQAEWERDFFGESQLASHFAQAFERGYAKLDPAMQRFVLFGSLDWFSRSNKGASSVSAVGYMITGDPDAGTGLETSPVTVHD